MLIKGMRWQDEFKISLHDPEMERISLDLPRAVKNRECDLEVGCVGVFTSYIRGILSMEIALAKSLSVGGARSLCSSAYPVYLVDELILVFLVLGSGDAELV